MTLSPTPGNIAQSKTSSPVSQEHTFGLVQVKDTGDVTPHGQLEDGRVPQCEPEAAKPWAHFVAGG